MDDLVAIGVVAASDGEDAGEPLHLRLHRIHSGERRVTITVPRGPGQAGIGPRGLLIDVERDDDAKEVQAPEPFPAGGET